MFDGSAPRYCLFRDESCKRSFLREVVESATFIRRKQVFEDGNHRTAMLFVMECCARYNLILRSHPLEMYIIISSLDEIEWELVVVRLEKWIKRNWVQTDNTVYASWRPRYTKSIKEIPF